MQATTTVPPGYELAHSTPLFENDKASSLLSTHMPFNRGYEAVKLIDLFWIT